MSGGQSAATESRESDGERTDRIHRNGRLDGREPVTVVGSRELAVPVHSGERDSDGDGGLGVGVDADPETAAWSFRCASGSEIGGPWTGVPVSDLLDAAEAPDATTHVAVEGDDGYRVCVPVSAALDGLLAHRSAGEPLDAPRFVAPGVSGVRTGKRVARIDAVALAPETDPEAVEELKLEEK
ncbi:molybdopterin-dependent oxidoreductase [Halorussus salilacus]|uniref:molybdopterin-dependent oxidoreductase n=1 Tax=Halorussus salilacus TaxID=2953750 RepID=UPI0020A15CF0|nr:molybdopterin-dependent oxidoreductase [Halorussus salilacus]USZ68449.1 molybdopterin-dependent oxidoreductase [Halorussus salilacus]